MASHHTALLVTAAALLCAVVAAPQGGGLTQEQLRALFMQNLMRFQSFPCRHPQKRSVLVADLLQREGKMLPSQVVTPPAAVLHVCGPSTGCCFSSDKVCAPASTETVTLQFRMDDAVRGGKYIETSLDFVNHTRCVCVSRTEASGTETNFIPQ